MITVVIPLLDEAGTLEALHRKLRSVLGSLGAPYELLFIDDGSRDGGAAILDRLADAHPEVGVVRFRRNFGKSAALDAGFARARGEIVVTMDADLQDDPEELPRLLAELDRQRVDVVSGWKKDRQDPLAKTLPSKFFNLVVRRISGLSLHDFNCGYKAYRAEVVRSLSLYGELHRYIPVLAHGLGFRVGELPVRHHPRRHGKSKYGWERMAKGFFDLLTVVLLTQYRRRPLHLFGWAGLSCCTVGVLCLAYLTVLWFVGLGPIGTRPLLFLGLLLVMVGVQLFSTGLLGEMINAGRRDPAAYSILCERLPAQRSAAAGPSGTEKRLGGQPMGE